MRALRRSFVFVSAVAILVLAGAVRHEAAAFHAVGLVSMAKAQETIFFESIRVMDDSPYVERMPVIFEVTDIVLGEFYLENPPHVSAGHQDIVADNFGFIRNIKAFPSGIGTNLRAKVPFDFSGREVTSVSDHYFDEGIPANKATPNLNYPVRVNCKMGTLHCLIGGKRIVHKISLSLVNAIYEPCKPSCDPYRHNLNHKRQTYWIALLTVIILPFITLEMALRTRGIAGRILLVSGWIPCVLLLLYLYGGP